MHGRVPASASYHFGLRPGVSCDAAADTLILRYGDASLQVRSTDAIRQAVERLAGDGGDYADMLAGSADPLIALKIQVFLDRLDELRWLTFSLRTGHGTARPSVTTAIPIAPTSDLSMVPQPWWQRHQARGAVRLSRFTYARWFDGVLVLRSPLSAYEVRATGSALASLLSALPVIPDSPGTAGLLDLLHRARMTSQAPEGAGAAVDLDESDDVVLRQWEFHDLLFHCHSRDGRDGRPSGGTFRFAVPDGEPAPAALPAVHPSYPGDVVVLAVPTRDGPGHEMSVLAALRTRRSIRRHGLPIDLEQLGAFLYYCARVDFIDSTALVQVSRRPYPSGGGLHELELYVVSNRCANLSPGVYHYRATEHSLCRVGGVGVETTALLDDAGYSMGHPQPQVLIVITSRFQRIAWKYEAIAYSLTLKHVGCLLQTMYLVATAMGLAPCAIGGGNSESFARLIGQPSLVESSVGEFSLGTCRPDLSSGYR